jgi:hypothetical protein
MKRSFSGPNSSVSRAIIASWLCAALLCALALSMLPRWHEMVHPDANSSQHECAVTLINSGNYQQLSSAPLVVVPVPVLEFCFVPTLRPVWVASSFGSARIFEHAPPVSA